MGLKLFGSSCDEDAKKTSSCIGAPCSPASCETKTQGGYEPPCVLPNPDPRNFNIITIYARGKRKKAAAVLVEYPGCTTYEGRKVIVYVGYSKTKLKKAAKLDPHFCNHESCISPFARFEPTEQGWIKACGLVDQLAKD